MLARNTPRGSDLSALQDEALMALIAQGQTPALEQIYDRYNRAIYGLALRMLAHTEQAEDVVQEVFWRVWRRGATFQASHGSVAAWIFGIAHNLCIDELRRRRSRPTMLYDTPDEPVLLELPDMAQDVPSAAWDAEQRRLIHEALRSIPADQRQVIELAYFAGLSHREIAERLDDPLGTIKTRMRLGLHKMRQVLQTFGIGHEDR